MQLEGIDHIALSVHDVEQSGRWYIDVLGFERQHADVWGEVPTFLGKGAIALALFPAAPESESSAPAKIRMLHLAFRADRKNFIAAQAELKRRGIQFEFQDHKISHSIYFDDPDGHELEITTYDLA